MTKQPPQRAAKSRQSLIQARQYRYVNRWQYRMQLTGKPLAETRDLYSKYQEQKFNAKSRGISFELTFAEWINLWNDSGHLAQRGCRKGKYVMARKGDKGPYSSSNVEIILYEENLSAQINNINRSSKYRKRMSKIMKTARSAKPDWYSCG